MKTYNRINELLRCGFMITMLSSYLAATMLGGQNVSAQSSSETASKQAATSATPTAPPVSGDQNGSEVLAVQTETHPSVEVPKEQTSIPELISQLQTIDDEDYGRFSLAKKERWKEVFKKLQQACADTVEVRRKMLKNDLPYARALAANLLGSAQSITSVKPLLETLGDPDPIVRGCVALALGQMGDHSAVPALVESMQDEHRGVRIEIAKALGHLASPLATKCLITSIKFKEDVPSCGVYAPLVIISMWRVGHRGRYNEPASWALAQIGPPAIDDLRAALRDPAGENHVYIAWSLSEIAKQFGDARALRALIDAKDDAGAEIQKLTDEVISEIKNSQLPKLDGLKELIDKLDRERSHLQLGK